MKVEIYKGVVCLEAGWLVDEIGIFSRSNYKQLCYRNKIRVLRRGCYGTPALVEWESLPERHKQSIISEHGNPEELVKRRAKKTGAWSVEVLMEIDASAEEFFTNYTFDNGNYLPPKRRVEYITNAKVMSACHKAAAGMTAKRKSLGAKVSGVWEAISDDVNSLDKDTYPHSLPANYRRLRERVNKYRKEGYYDLIHKNYRNQSASKIDDDIKESVLIELMGHKNNLDAEQIAKAYNHMGERMNWKEITASTVRHWQDKLNLVTYAGARGEREFKSNKTMQVKRQAPTAPLYYWTLDGWNAELLYQQTSTSKDGKKRTTYHHRMTIVVVLDPCNKYPIGYAIGEAENPGLIKQAIRNAINHTKELWGERYRPHQLQSDHYGRGNLTPMYEEVAKMYTPAQIGNAKAKIVEPYFLYLNKNYCQFLDNWSGFGATARRELQPNSDVMNKIKRSAIPTAEVVIHQLETIMQLERQKKVGRYMELWNAIPQEKRLPMTQESYLYLFGERTEPNRMVGGGLQPKVLGQRVRFDSFDMGFHQEAASEHWTICFDPDDPSEGVAISTDETKRYRMRQAHVQPMALMDRQEGDAEKLQEVYDFNDLMMGAVIDKRSKAHELTAALINDNPQLNDTLAKMLLTDSRGQHKDRLSEAQGKAKPKPMRIEIENTTSTGARDLRSLLIQEADFSEYE